MIDREHQEIQDDIAAFVLGALDEPRRSEVESHLEDCDACQGLARRLGPATAALALANEPVDPPDELKRRILTAAGSGERALQARRSVRALPPTRRLGRFPRTAVAGLSLVAGILIGLGVGRVIAPPAPAPAVAHYTLAGSGKLAGATGMVTRVPGESFTVVDFRGLPALDESKVYELWLLPAAGQPVPAGVFRPDVGGGKTVVVTHDLKGVHAIAVTIEAAPDGSTAPTQAPELSGTVA